MILKNTHKKLSNEVVRAIIKFVRPSGVKNFDVMIKNSDGGIAGTCYPEGSSYHATRNPFIVCRVPFDKFPRMMKPYQYAQLKGKSYPIMNLEEACVYIMAHELRHLWQAKAKNKRGYTHGSKGRYSEIDTESYAIGMLRKWRLYNTVGALAPLRAKQLEKANVTITKDNYMEQKEAIITNEKPNRIQNKLNTILERKKKWESKMKRAKNAIKKLDRQIKYYEKKQIAKTNI